MRHREAARRRLAAIGLPPGPVAVTPAQAAQLARCGAAAAVLPTIAAPTLSGATTSHDIPWLKSVSRDLGIAWHRRLMDIRPKAEKILNAMEDALRA